MRTTVEDSDDQHRAADEVELLLGLEGSLSDSDANEMRSRINDVRIS